uniref:G-protein coupled receptors family 3 profile domain-containing protein n=1 Tax=Leptobrachium leishanense TaxID=445787 RepID=A0A8C5MUL3_9ANUR
MSFMHKTIWHLIVFLLIPVFYSEDQRCRLPITEPKGMTQPGDIMIGVLLPLHFEKVYQTFLFNEKPPRIKCTMFHLESVQQLQAVRFALDEINKNAEIHPNITLGFRAYDSCSFIQYDLEGALQILTGLDRHIPNYRCSSGAPLSSMIGTPFSIHSVLLASVLGIYKFPQLLYYIKNVRFRLNNEKEVYFDKNGDPPAVYDIVNRQLSPTGNMRFVKVGSYDMTAPPHNIFTINTSSILWNSGETQVPISVCSQSCTPGFWKAARKGEPVCCYDCVPCPQGEISNHTDSFNCVKCPWDMWPNPEKSSCLPKPIEFLSYEEPLGTTLACTSTISSLVPVIILKLFLQFKTTPIVKANNYSLSCLLLLSLSFCFLCSLMFIGFPKPENCLLRQAAFGMVFSLCVSCILAKTIMVVFAFMATKPGSNLKKWTSPWMSYMIISICLLLQFILCVTWLSINPPFLEQNIETQPSLIILQCNEGSPTAFWSMLGYLGLLATISFVVAFLARRLPGSFNEAKYITFSMLAFLSVWVSYIPASLSSQGKYTVAMEIFAILASSWAIVFCMFVPKCFIILFRPSMNSREYVMKKGQTMK